MRIVPSGALGLTFATTVIVAEAPLARVPRLQVRGCNGLPGIPPLQEPWLGAKLTILTSAGSTSFTTTLGAADGPLFVTFKV